MRGALQLPSDRSPAISSARLWAVLFILILVLGVLARTWEWPQLPPGLNQDEASNGVDAASIYRYGTDRNGVAYPIKFVSWGGGQDALYGYLLIPLISILGLSPAIVRIPMLIGGILSMPLLYLVARQTFGERLGLLSMFFLAISPWHILLSRWGLESNFFPFVFLAAYACLLQVRRTGAWFVAACVVLGISLYSYGTSYAVVPVFVLAAIAILIADRRTSRRYLALGAVVFTVLALPVGLLVLINALHFPSISLGPATVPLFPVEARFSEATVFGSPDIASAISSNVLTALRLLIFQSDGSAYGVVEPYGYFYRWSFPVALLGIGLLIRSARRNSRLEILLLIAWIGAASLVGVFQAVNINRFNIMFMPLILSTAVAVDWLSLKWRLLLPISVIALLIAFAAFTAAYHGSAFRIQADRRFNAGLLSALRFARGVASNEVCITDRINMPYIFVLFSEQPSPSSYLRTVEYLDPEAPLRQVASFGRYVFGTRNCVAPTSYTYVLTTDEIPPRLGNRYKYEFFQDFVVYYPKR